jgi:CDP-2,3-bis-(O-geranylgeranyl)-sn-glycerol synthase
MSIGALTGDLVGSFIKRRIKLPRGRPAPLLDQLDFLAGALIITLPFHPLIPFHLFILLVLTPLIHFVANIFGYILRFKKEPW